MYEQRLIPTPRMPSGPADNIVGSGPVAAGGAQKPWWFVNDDEVSIFMLCERCDEVTEAVDSAAAAALAALCGSRGFTGTSQIIEITGVCQACQTAQN